MRAKKTGLRENTGFMEESRIWKFTPKNPKKVRMQKTHYSNTLYI